MNDATEILMHIISHEIRYVKSMHHTLKEDELTILRLQNKARVQGIEIEERKQLIDEYRGYLKDISEAAQTRMKLIPSTNHQMDTKSSATQSKVTQILEKQG